MRETLADELERLSDPRLGFVTITGVEVSPDICGTPTSTTRCSARPRSGSRARTRCGRRAPDLRAAVGRQVRLKFVPELRFREDPAIAQGQRIEEIIRSIHEGAVVPDEEGRS